MADEDWGASDAVQTLSLDDAGDVSAETEAALKAATANPGDAAAQAALGEAYLRDELYEESVAAYDKALAIDSANAGFLKGKAQAQIAGGEYEEAQATLTAALSADANNAGLLFLLGNAYKGGDDHKNARDAYSKAVAADGNHAQALLAVATYDAQDEKSKDAALEAFKKVAELDSSNAAAFAGAAGILEAKGELKDAAGFLAKAAAADPTDVNRRGRLVRLYDALGQDADREAARTALHADYSAGNLGSGGSAVNFCCSQFESGDKVVMGFDYFVPDGDKKTKYSFNVYPKGQVHEDNITATYKVELVDGHHSIVKYPGGSEVEALGDAAPDFGQVKEAIKKLAA